MEDNKIIELYFARSEEAISETDKKYGAYCRKISNNILADKRDVEECVSDAYLQAWNSIPPERPKKLSAWLGRIVRNISINRYEGNSAEKRGGGQIPLALSELVDCISSSEGIEAGLEKNKLTEAVEIFLLGLPDESRKIFVRRYWYLDPVKDIAEMFGTSENRISVILHRTRKLLKTFLEKEGITL